MVAPTAPKAAPPLRTNGVEGFSPEVEAFRAEVAASSGSEFADWRRAQRSSHILTWVVAVVFLSPGLICFLFQAPLSVSISMEVAGFIANAWVRRRRRQRLKDIVAWEAPTEV